MVDVSLIIVNWNTSGMLYQCLDSIFKTGSSRTLEVIVVDNGSTDGSVAMMKESFPQVEVIRNDQNVGFAKANNQALSIGVGKYFLLLNSDTIMLPGCIDKLVELADLYPDVGVVGPRVLNMDGTIQLSWGAFPSVPSELVGKYIRTRHTVPDVSQVYEVDWVLGACMLVRATTVEDAGQLDGEFFFYSEEIDWCYRIKKQNWRVWYFDNPALYHLGGGSTQSGSFAQLIRLYRGKLIYFRKHHGLFKATLLRFGLAFANLFGVVRRIVTLNWLFRTGGSERIVNQSKLVWCLLRNQYPNVD